MTKTQPAWRGAIAGVVLSATAHAADATWIYAVQMSAEINADPARVELKWPGDAYPILGYTIYRKAPGAAAWGEGLDLHGPVTSFVDDGVEVGRVYEYQIVKHGSHYTGYGYIAVPINAPLVDARGRLILVVDRSIAEPLAGELHRFQQDLAGDGWTVVRTDVGRDAAPAGVRALIKEQYDADKAGTKAVLLLGHIPVVRSGSLNVDGHGARPMPADVFYAEMDGPWTDTDGDGIYDQNTLPSDVDLQIGRVDFANLPGRESPVAYPGEVDLLRRYLDKNHAYRHAVVRPPARALIGNSIGDGNGQAYAAAAYRSLAPLVGAANVITVETQFGTPNDVRWLAHLTAREYLWAFGCGAGSNFTIGALGDHGMWSDLWASDFIERRPKATFYTLFGSWFAEWHKPDNVLRTALAAPEHGLAAAWSGRPHLFLHHMAMGETIGYGIRVSQNNSGHYQNQEQRQLRGVHIALMGDPTLRAQQLAPPTEATVVRGADGVVVSWKPSADPVLGYHVYRGSNPNGPFNRITEALADERGFVDPSPPAGATIYMVRAVALQVGPGGSFYHASQGAFVAVDAGPAQSAAGTHIEPAHAFRPEDVVWIDDDLPEGAIGYATEDDRWNWVSADPSPISGARAHQSEIADGWHHHFFAFATAPLAVNAGDTLFAYVYLDPANPPRQVILTWCSEHWEHRAYWGENLIGEGVDGSDGRRYAGPLPPTGRWVRLEIPASAVGMENKLAVGMGFTLFDGRATWDRAGKSRP